MNQKYPDFTVENTEVLRWLNRFPRHIPSPKEWLITKISDTFLCGVPVVESVFVEPVYRTICVDRNGEPVGLEFSESTDEAVRWISDRFNRQLRRNIEYDLTQTLRLCDVCTRPLVDECGHR